VGLERGEKCPVMHDGPVDLALEKLRAALHGPMGSETCA
jgi:hypothetical protein